MDFRTKTNSESGFVAVILVVVVAGLLVWGAMSLFKGKDDPASNSSATSISAIASKIQADKNVDVCTYTDNRDDSSVRLLLGKATTNFVNLAKAIDTNVCKTFQYGLFLKTTDSRGETSNTSIATFRLEESNRDKFKLYDWNKVTNQNIGEQLKADAILTKINLNVDSVSLDDVKYKGDEKELQ